jgi:carbon starvation protein CstA
VFAGKLFPFAFITIACGAVSGFHALISSGTTPKMVSCEPDARLVGYGSMLTESLVGVMAMVAAATLDPGVYFAMNVGPATLGANSETASQTIAQWGFMVSPQQLNDLARQMGEATLLSRTGGAPSLAVGMAGILGGVFTGPGLALWYHFAIMFEAVFILTTIDAGTRVGRFMLQELLGHVYAPLGRVSWYPSILISSLPRRARLGLLPLSGRHRSARRHQLAVAPVRDRESAARRGGALRRGDDPDQDGEDPLLVGAARATGVACGSDAHRRMAESVLAGSEARVPVARGVARHQHLHPALRG